MANTAPESISGPVDPLWAQRTGKRQYLAHNSRGASVKIGKGEGEFSPGELLKLALATCHTLSADAPLAKALGPDFDATVWVSADYDEEADIYRHMQVEIVTESGPADGDVAALTEAAAGAIDKYCTIGHTLKDGVGYDFNLSVEG